MLTFRSQVCVNKSWFLGLCRKILGRSGLHSHSPVLLCVPTALQFVQAVKPMIDEDLLVRTAHPLGNVVEHKVSGWVSEWATAIT